MKINRKTSCVHELKIIIKMSILPKVINRYSAISTKTPVSYFTAIYKQSSSLYETTKNSKSPRQFSTKKNKTRDIILPKFKISYKDIVNKTLWHCHKNRHRVQWNRRANTKINLYSYSQMIFDKGIKNTHISKDTISTKWCWKNWMSTCRRKRWSLCLLLCTAHQHKMG